VAGLRAADSLSNDGRADKAMRERLAEITPALAERLDTIKQIGRVLAEMPSAKAELVSMP
jgi:hypothetical protein